MKETLRTDMIRKRNTLSTADVREKSTLIQNQLFSLSEFSSSHSILFYVSYDNEVFTHQMIKDSLSLGKHVIVPYVDMEKKQLNLSKLYHWQDLSLGTYGILEPKQEYIHQVSVGDVDLIIVPGIVFDCMGQRIGHGLGYYDRLLQKGIRTLKIGLAFELQLVENIPAEKHDMRVDAIITEKRLICCNDTT